MKEKERILRIFAVTLCMLCVLVGIAKVLDDKKKEKNPVAITDAEKFKEEYESYNDKKRDADNYYTKVTIGEKNPIKYANIEEVLKILDKGTAVIYFGFPTCPWCRNAIPVLFEAASKEDITTIYYLNVNDYKNIYVVQDGKVVKTQEEKEGYYDLLKALDSVLSPYTISDSEGVTYEVGEKRIYVPMMVFVKEGSIVGTHVGTVDLEDGQTKYDSLTDSQHDELLKIYRDYMKKVKSVDYCDEEC